LVGTLRAVGNDAVFESVAEGVRVAAAPGASRGVWKVEWADLERKGASEPARNVVARGEAKVDESLHRVSALLEEPEKEGAPRGPKRKTARFEITLSPDARQVEVQTVSDKEETTAVFLRQ
jgi:hypothetical protein